MGREVPPVVPPRLVVQPGSRQEVFALYEGDVVVSCPEKLSPESYADLEAYLEIFLRKAKRWAESTRHSQHCHTLNTIPAA